MLSLKEKIAYIFLGLLMLALVALYVFEFYYFQRTFGLKGLLLVSAMLGAALGAALGWRLSRDAEDEVDRIRLYLLCIMLAAIFLPLFASLSNRLLSPHPARLESVVFFEEKPYVSERFGVLKGEEVRIAGYYLFFHREGELLRIDNRHSLSPPPQRGDTILIPVRKGIWGVNWVESDRTPWTSNPAIE